MTTARIQSMLDKLADERDRLDDQVRGFEIAVNANCVASVLTAILLPGIGFVITAAARAACAIGNGEELRRRIAVVESVIADIERLGDRVALVDPNDEAKVTRVEAEVLATLDKVRRVDIVDDLLNNAAAAARSALNALQFGANVVSSIGTAVLVVGVVGGVAWFFAGRR